MTACTGNCNQGRLCTCRARPEQDRPLRWLAWGVVLVVAALAVVGVTL